MLPLRVLVAGDVSGAALVLDEPLSFWGGLDPKSGLIIGRHPQAGESVAGKILVMPGGRGSSSSSSVLAEALRAGKGPAGIVMRTADEIVALGALVASELYGTVCAVVVAEVSDHPGIQSGMDLTIRDDRLEGSEEAST